MVYDCLFYEVIMKIGTSSLGNLSLSMQQTDPRHFNTAASHVQAQDVENSFADALFKAVDAVNSEQTKADYLQQEAILAPDSVNVASVLIAVEKARLSAGMLKSIAERASRAYTDIMNIR